MARSKAGCAGLMMSLSGNELEEWRRQVRDDGLRLVATNGCFDLLHIGHVRYLQQAKALGDLLIVGVNSDASVRELKGPTRPLNKESDRAEVLAALGCVDAVSVFEGKRATEFLKAVEPDVYVKGGDYTVDSLDADEVASVRAGGGDIKILPLTEGKSTTNLIEKMNHG